MLVLTPANSMNPTVQQTFIYLPIIYPHGHYILNPQYISHLIHFLLFTYFSLYFPLLIDANIDSILATR